ncbi:MAG: hypothetical protein H0T53_05170 [Herpetosiphonaceae bacterium]|nr:hypothetical protein [Herpetosiphonaceae bacterium]
MSRTLAEIVIAVIVVVIFFRLGVELAPVVMDWWRDTGDAASGDDERNDNDNE